MRLEGSLDAFSLPDIFALLSMTKKTGALHLRRADAHGVVWFTTGGLTGGASDVGRQAFARRVVGTGSVDDAALAAAVDRAAEDTSTGVVRALQQAGAVEEGLLHDLGAEHVVDTVFDLLRWPDGDFAFVVDEANPDDIGVSRQVDDVVAEARRRLDAWSSVAAVIPSSQTVLALAASPLDDPQVSREDWALLALVDGRRPVADVVALAGRGEFAVVSALADLTARGLLRVADADEAAALLRRQQLLARLETGGSAEPSPPTLSAVPPAVPEQAPPTLAAARPAPTEQAPAAAGAGDGEGDVQHGDDIEAPAAGVVTALLAARDADVVTPKRPEPFLPKRQPEHPEEPPPALAAVAGGGAAPSAAAAALIERDPSVNKSLLLRLIAGVRGL